MGRSLGLLPVLTDHDVPLSVRCCSCAQIPSQPWLCYLTTRSIQRATRQQQRTTLWNARRSLCRLVEPAICNSLCTHRTTKFYKASKIEITENCKSRKFV